MKKQFIIIIMIISCLISQADSETTYFTDYTRTPNFIQYLGTVTLEANAIEQGQDELGVFVDNDTDQGLLVGATVIGDLYNDRYLVSVHGDDTTTDIQDGADANDILTFKVWDKSENKLYVLSDANSISAETATGIVLPSLPPTYTANNLKQYGDLNLNVRNQDLSISLVRFKAIAREDQVEIFWTTASEINVSGFLLDRKCPSEETYTAIEPTPITSTGDSTNGDDYNIVDKNGISHIYCEYRLILVDLDGQQSIIGSTTSQPAINSNLDMNEDDQFGIADIIILMKRIVE